MASTFPGSRRGDGIGKASPMKSKAFDNVTSDDNFYSSLAAELEEESDVSEADVSKMLADMDDMEDDLFGSTLKSRPSSAVPKKKPDKEPSTKATGKEKPALGQTFTLNQTLEDELTEALNSSPQISPTASPRRSKPKTQNRKFDFGEFDEDDPLAGLLSDDEDGPKKPAQKKPTKVTKTDDPPRQEQKLEPEPKPEPEPVPKENQKETAKTKRNSAKEDAAPASKFKAKTIGFDDDDDDSDILGSLGLEKSLKGGSTDTDVKKEPVVSSSRPGRSRGKSEPEADFGDESDLLGSLGLGVSPREKRRSRPDESQEVEQARNKVNELFGSSSSSKMTDKPPAGKPRQSALDKILQKKDKDTAPKAKVKEETEEDFSFGDYTPSSVTSRPESAPPSRRSVRFSDEDDIGGTSLFDRPRSRANMSAVLDEPVQRPKSAAAATSSSRRTGRNSRVDTTPSDDWLELAAGPNTKKADDKPTDSGKKTTASDKQAEPPKKGLSLSALETSTVEEKKPLPVKAKPKEEPPPARAPSAADYLGLSDTDIDPDSLVQPKPLTPRGGTPMDSTMDDPFNLPAKRDTISPFPWDSSNTRQPATSTPQPADDFDMSDNEEDPMQTSKMAQQIQQLQKLQEQQQQPQPQQQRQQQQQQPQQQQQQQQQKQQLQQQQQQQVQPGRHTASDMFLGSQQAPSPTPQPREPDISDKPAQRGPKKEPQWRQQLRQKQQQQQQEGHDKQQASSSGTGQAASQAVNMPTTPQMPSPLVSATPASSLPGYTLPTPQPTHQIQPVDNAWQEQLERSQLEMEQALKNQQAQWASQQQSMQQQLQQQQQQVVQQQQQAMQQQLKMQEALLKAQTAPPMATLPMPGASPLMMPGLQSYGHEDKVHQLESQKRRLEAELQALQQAQQQQTTAMQNAHKDYIQLLEESASRRETRLRQEHTAALEQYEHRIKHIQGNHAAQQEQQQLRVQQMNTEHSSQLQQLQQTHRLAMEAIQQQHQQQLQQVKLTMQREMEAINSTQTHSKSLQAVVDQVQSASQELGSLQSQVHNQHHNQLEQRSMELKDKDKQLQALENRLSKKQDEMNEERARLEAMINRLEAHIRQQNTQLDEERFRLRQEQSKLSSLQRASEEERKLAAEQLVSQQTSLQQAKDALLDDQKTIMAQCLEERRSLASERAQVAGTRRQLEASLQEHANKALQVGAEQDGKLESLISERTQLTTQAASLQQQQQAMQQEKLQLSHRRQELDSEQRRLQQLAETLRQRSQQIQETVTEGLQAREDGQAALQAARTIEAEQSTREMNIHSQLQALRASQRQIAQERLDLAREQRNLEKLRGSIRCHLCSGSVAQPRAANISSPTQAWPTSNSIRHTPNIPRSPQLTEDGNHYQDRSTAPSRTLSLKDVDTLLSQAELGHSLRMWKVAAEKDKEFLEEESVFLETLKTPVPVGYVQKA